MTTGAEVIELELDVGAVAHGGFCIARHDGRVVFVRHALPGERVRARITEDRGGSFVRADAVQIIVPSPDRVEPPCRYAGAGGCGGCDWQHVTAQRQRELKADVVREQFRRIAGLDVAALLGEVRELPGGMLGWRTRITYAVDGDGRPGLHRHRSGEVVPVAECLLGTAGVGDSAVLRDEWPGLTGVEVTRDDDGTVAVLAHRPGPGRQARGRRPPDRVEVVRGPDELARTIRGRRFAVGAAGFWQVHPGAADAFGQALLGVLRPAAGETVVDLYCGAGALTAALGTAVGVTGRVVGIEADPEAVRHAQANLADLPWVQVRRGRVDVATIRSLGLSDGPAKPDLFVVDPPRAGVGQQVMAELLALTPRAIGYVACDPAALARDVAVAVAAGWRLDALEAIDAFPMTHHVECIARLVPTPTGG